MRQHVHFKVGLWNAERNRKTAEDTSQTLQAPIKALNFEDQDSEIGKRLHKYDLLGRVASRKPHLPKKT